MLKTCMYCNRVESVLSTKEVPHWIKRTKDMDKLQMSHGICNSPQCREQFERDMTLEDEDRQQRLNDYRGKLLCKK